MAFDNRITPDPAANPLNSQMRETVLPSEGDLRQPAIIEQNPQMPTGVRTRQLFRWRVPGINGFIDMYLNPQQFNIQLRKIITRRRINGGYVVQYWGEDLPVLSINGSTGAAGVGESTSYITPTAPSRRRLTVRPRV